MTDSEDLYQIALLIDQLKHDDQQLRLAASKSIVSIAIALGAERTRNELIPFLTESTDDEDEILCVVAEKLGELIDCIGGEEHIHVLLVPIERLVCGEENAVRLAALRTAEKIVSKMTEHKLTIHYLPMISKLANRDWFTSRGSAAALAHLCYNRLSLTARQEVRGMFVKLCADDTPFVRRAAAQNLVNMIEMQHSVDGVSASTAEGLADFIESFKNFARDDQDSIRILVIPIGIALLRHLTSEAKTTHVLPVVLQIAGDRSWRVRWSLANHLHEVLQGMEEAAGAATPIGSSLAAVFDALLNDTEPEVRAASAAHLSVVCRRLPQSVVVSKILPTAQRLVNDSSEFVRAFFAIEVNYLSPLLGREATVQHILPLLLSLLRDETSEVRLNVISSLNAINSIIGIDLLSQSLLPAIVDLAQDQKWRVRLAIIDHMPMLGQQLGVEFFNEKLVALCIGWLADEVYSIRKAGATNLHRLTQLFGSDWCRDQILPKIEKMHNGTSFSQRLTALYAIQVLVASLSSKTVETRVVPLIAAMALDTVPNIRFTVAKTLQAALPVLRAKDLSTTEAAAILFKLAADPDRDVRYYAEKAQVAYKEL